MEYQYLDTDQQKAMLEARLQQLENEHFGHAQNKKLADGDEEKIKAADEAMAIIDAAYDVAKKDLAAITKSAPAAKPTATPK